MPSFIFLQSLKTTHSKGSCHAPQQLSFFIFFGTFIPNKKQLYRIPSILRQTRTREQPSRVFPLIIRVPILSTSLFRTPQLVRQATCKCLETKVRKNREVQEFIGHQHARVKLLDNSAVSRGHINFDDGLMMYTLHL